MEGSGPGAGPALRGLSGGLHPESCSPRAWGAPTGQAGLLGANRCVCRRLPRRRGADCGSLRPPRPRGRGAGAGGSRGARASPPRGSPRRTPPRPPGRVPPPSLPGLRRGGSCGHGQRQRVGVCAGPPPGSGPRTPAAGGAEPVPPPRIDSSPALAAFRPGLGCNGNIIRRQLPFQSIHFSSQTLLFEK